jgi:flagellin
MPLVISTNIASLQAQTNLARTQESLSSSFQKLSSGFRINSAADDAAGLAISETMRAHIRSYAVAERNTNNAISMAQVAEGSLGSISGILQRMRELSVQGANGDLTSQDRGYLNVEFSKLKEEINRISQSTTYNGKNILGATAVPIDFQVGINSVTADRITVTFGGVTLSTLGIANMSVGGATAGASSASITAVDAALASLNSRRASYGAAMNRLQVTVSNLETMKTNVSAANSRIRDVDVAEETAMLARNQVLSQAGAAVLGQANQLPQIALGLLRGG